MQLCNLAWRSATGRPVGSARRSCRDLLYLKHTFGIKSRLSLSRLNHKVCWRWGLELWRRREAVTVVLSRKKCYQPLICIYDIIQSDSGSHMCDWPTGQSEYHCPPLNTKQLNPYPPRPRLPHMWLLWDLSCVISFCKSLQQILQAQIPPPALRWNAWICTSRDGKRLFHRRSCRLGGGGGVNRHVEIQEPGLRGGALLTSHLTLAGRGLVLVTVWRMNLGWLD